MWEAVRKFGLEYCDFPTMLSNVSTMLRTLALNIDGRNKKRIPIACVILMVVCSMVFIYAYVLSGFWYTFWHAYEIGEISGAFTVFSLNILSQVIVIKLYFMIFLKKKFETLTNKYLDMDASIANGSRFSNNMLKNLRYVKRRGIVYWFIVMVNAVVYLILPLLRPGRHLSLETFVIYGLEPMLESPNYEIATACTTIAIMFITYTAANVTCFLILLIGYIEAQMLSLSDEMVHIYDDAVHNFKKIIDKTDKFKTKPYKNISPDVETAIINQYIEEHLIAIINKHAMNISNMQEIEDIMRIPNAISFLYFIIGLIAELLGGLENTWLQLPFTMLLISVDCYLGQKVMDSNIKFEQAVYFCKWEYFNVSNRKIVFMMLQNSQKTMTLTAGGMAILSFTCLMAIITNTYSAYTTLGSLV